MMKWVTTFAVIGALSALPADRVQADAGDLIGGAILGAIIGSAASQGNQGSSRSSTRPRSTIPRTQVGRDTQTALNYFGFNAGRVDGQIGSGTRGAIERFQASMGYPVNGRDWQPYQFDFLMQAYYWGVNGGAMQTRLSGQRLLMAYRQQLQTGTALAGHGIPAPGMVPNTTVTTPSATVIVNTPSPAPVTPTPTEAAEPQEVATEAVPALPNLFAGSRPAMSLANRCNAVMLQTSTNGGYATLTNMSDPSFTLSEQFCLARSYAMARGEGLMGGSKV